MLCATRPLGIILLAATLPAGAAAQTPVTRAEATDYMETSRYADVLAFLAALAPSPVLHRTTFGYSQLGRPLPLVAAGRGIASAQPGEVRAAGGTRVLILGNIHGGEVEGKEAAQMLLRSMAAGHHAPWLDSLVILVVPIYNADGNDAVSVLNRSRQHGPFGGVGERENAQGLDLNRDHMKLESAEARSLVRLLREYDPHVVVDLHTTNGTRHAYHLTYAPPLHPGTDPGIQRLARSEWLPALTRALREGTGWHSWHYGNASAPEGGVMGWHTFDHRPRFNNNYVGLRNRIALLSEAYSYAPFQDRVAVTLAFVEAVLDLARARGAAARAATAAADAALEPDDQLPLRARIAAGGDADILMGAVEERLNPFSGRRYLARLPVVERTRMKDFTRFEGVESERVPSAYYVPGSLHPVLDRLALHGIRTRALTAPRTARVERFALDSTRAAAREFQDHREREAFGSWSAVEATLPAGTMVVPTTQPLGRLVFYLLEPRSDDGLLNWNVLDAAIDADPSAYPILRAPAGTPPLAAPPAGTGGFSGPVGG
ncbi:MAG TPA: M14 family metallopeptidase [Longimicrobiales bacterium]|nr:M14 family metallopeptidase [Longimicrobiales bacterium]